MQVPVEVLPLSHAGRGRSDRAERAALAVVGIGNPLAGDDGLGPHVIECLRRRLGVRPGLVLEALEGDLYAVADLLGSVRRIVLVDAILGAPPGMLVERAELEGIRAASLHRADITVVMAELEALELVECFPEWELWGVGIEPQRELRIGLSEAVARAADRLVERLSVDIEKALAGATEPA